MRQGSDRLVSFQHTVHWPASLTPASRLCGRLNSHLIVDRTITFVSLSGSVHSD